jgi:hypothetical protein
MRVDVKLGVFWGEVKILSFRNESTKLKCTYTYKCK